MKELLYWLLGGRPMYRNFYAFTDVVSGKRIYYWTDTLGRPWLAEGPWSWFRVRVTDDDIMARIRSNTW